MITNLDKIYLEYSFLLNKDIVKLPNSLYGSTNVLISSFEVSFDKRSKLRELERNIWKVHTEYLKKDTDNKNDTKVQAEKYMDNILNLLKEKYKFNKPS